MRNTGLRDFYLIIIVITNCAKDYKSRHSGLHRFWRGAKALLYSKSRLKIMRRSQEQIIESILETCKKSATITRIVYSCNLNFKTVHHHVNGLMAAGLIEVPGKRGNLYQTTKKGLQVLENMHALRDLLKPG